MKTLIRIVFIIFIANGINYFGNICDDCDNCCDCCNFFKIKKFEEIGKDESIKAEDFVSPCWYEQKKGRILKIFKEKDDNNLPSIRDKEKKIIKLKEYGSIKLYCLEEKNMDLKMKDQKWAFFEIKTNEDQKSVYLYCDDVESFNFWGIFTDMKYKSISVIACNIENVKDMSYMFCQCNDLKILNIKNFNTKNVNNMNYMFNGCSSLENLKIGKKFKIENKTNISFMFDKYMFIETNIQKDLKNVQFIIDYFKRQTEKEDPETK